MTFELATPPNVVSKSMPTKPDQTPVIIFPGVLGNSIEMEAVIQELLKISPARPIYIYNDPLLKSSNVSSLPSLSLHEKIEEMAGEIRACFPYNYNVCPITFIGFSYGCTYAALLAQRIKKYKTDSLVYLIDGLSPEFSKIYFTDKSTSHAATCTIIDITNYAAKLSSFRNINLSEKELVKLAEIEIEPRIEQITKFIFQQKTKLNIYRLNTFERYSKIFKENLLNIVNYQNLTPPIANLTIKTLFTSKTLAQFASNTANTLGGWEAYAESIENDKHLIDQSHMNLITGENARYIAQSVDTFIQKHISEESILTKKLQLVANQMKVLAEKKNPHIKSNQFNIVSNMINSAAGTLSLPSSPANSSPTLTRSPSQEIMKMTKETKELEFKLGQVFSANEDLSLLKKDKKKKNLSYSQKFFTKKSNSKQTEALTNGNFKVSTR